MHLLLPLSHELNRVIGLLIDRKGHVQGVIIGDAQRLYLPDLGRQRAGGTRFRGLRLLRTYVQGDPLAQDDLTDLVKLKLDAVASLHAHTPEGRAVVHWAHLVPSATGDQPWRSETTALHQQPGDFAAFVQDLEAQFEAAAPAARDAAEGERAILVYVRTRDDRFAKDRIDELRELCRTARLELVDTYTQTRAQLDPRYAVGSGAVEELELKALQLGADLLVFGQDLNAAQLRSLSAKTNLRIVDRTQLILDIFAQRAQTRGGKLQVELAQLQYSLPRLSGRGTAMSRLAGGIGGRGPGESQLELDRRRARDRMNALERAIDELSSKRELRRKSRKEGRVPVVSIVGYTNAGKSTLLNTLTRATVLAEDKLFATLDPTSRRLRFPEDRSVVLTDTVGFIRDLPDALRKAFRATLEELHDADLLLHVVDASDPAWRQQRDSTLEILRELELHEKELLLVFNKADRVDPMERIALESEFPDAIHVCALDRATTKALIDRIDRWLVEHGHGDRRAYQPSEQSGDDHLSDEGDIWDEGDPDIKGVGPELPS